MPDHKIYLQDTMSLTDEVSAQSSLNPSVIRDEFELYRSNLTSKSGSGEFIVLYIILQVYIENHFHYYLRFLIGDGFTSGEVRPCWKEINHPPEKITCLKATLEKNKLNFDADLFDRILSNYRLLTDARNALAHGHQITKTYVGGAIEESHTKKLLTYDSFNQMIKSVNDLIKDWDNLMDQLLSQEVQCKTARLPQGGFFEHCKFKNPL
jgi:hypothetical protein